jgi:hypothetical protein
MRITRRHWAARHGRPIFLNASGEVMADVDGLRQFLAHHVLGRKEFSRFLGGHWSPRAVRSWLECSRPIPVSVLNILEDVLEDERAALLKKRLPSLGGKVGVRS